MLIHTTDFSNYHKTALFSLPAPPPHRPAVLPPPQPPPLPPTPPPPVYFYCPVFRVPTPAADTPAQPVQRDRDWLKICRACCSQLWRVLRTPISPSLLLSDVRALFGALFRWLGGCWPLSILNSRRDRHIA